MAKPRNVPLNILGVYNARNTSMTGVLQTVSSLGTSVFMGGSRGGGGPDPPEKSQKNKVS